MSSSEQLCLACGLCCDGTLFTHVSLAPAEAQALAQRGLAVVARADGTQALPQRCGALSGRCCTVYAERPAGCRRYRCMLLGALEEGEVDLQEALGVVAEAQARVAAGARVEAFLDAHFRGRLGGRR